MLVEGRLWMTAKETARDRLMRKLVQVFLEHGFEHLTMRGISKAADISPRSLYNYVSSKEEALCESIRWMHGGEIRAGLAAGRRVLDEGGGAVDVLVAIFDTRYGMTRRNLGVSAHAADLNAQAFRRCYAVMTESAATFQDDVSTVLDDLSLRRLLILQPGVTSAELSQLLADGARGVNQTLPARPESTLPERYRRMIEALLFGSAERAGPS